MEIYIFKVAVTAPEPQHFENAHQGGCEGTGTFPALMMLDQVHNIPPSNVLWWWWL